jgi:hypothetical protein
MGSSCGRRICQLCRDPEASPQPGHDRLPLPSADTTQRFPRNATPCTIIPGPKANLVVFVILQITLKQPTNENRARKVTQTPPKWLPTAEQRHADFGATQVAGNA